MLLVDDDPLQRKLNAVRIAHLGLRVRAAAEATEALAMARLERPDAILSDVVMGDVDGFSFCRMVRNDATLAGVPVVLVSSHFHGARDRELAAAVGADELVERTPDFNRELDALARSLERRVVANDSAPSTVAELHSRAVAGQLTRMAHDSRNMETKYRALFESASDAVSIVDSNGIVLDINHRWEELLQRERSAIVGHHIHEFAAPGHSQADEIVPAAALRAGGAVQLVALARSDGTIAHVEISTVAVPVNDGVTTFAIGRDVTETVEAKRKLELSEQKYRSLIENIPDVIWSMTAEGKITFVSPSAFALTGYTPEELRPIHEEDRFARVHPDDRASVEAALRAMLDGGEPIDLEIRTRHKDGSWRWVRTRATPFRDQQGRTERIDGIDTDVTERKRLEEQVRRAQKLEAVGQLTSGVAHDFNNTLAVILGNAHFLLEDLLADDPRRADADDIRQAAERAACLTRQLLAFSRQHVVEPSVVELSAVALGLERMLRRLISEDIALVLEAPPDAGNVRADPCHLEQVIMNLVVNARDAMPDGGSLKVETARFELRPGSPPVFVQTADGRLPAGDYVRLTIRDTGTGMDDHVKQHIFEPFFTTKGPGKGTGLGLSTCFGIVQQSRGFIAVDSAPEQGTAFHVYFPRIDGGAGEVGKTEAAARTARNDETVLLVEDDLALRKTLQRALRECGFRVLTAGDGCEALALAVKQQRAIDLVLSDVVLPDINGIDVTCRLHSLMPHAKFVLMSGHTEHALLENRALAGSPMLLRKPFAPNELAQKLRAVLDA